MTISLVPISEIKITERTQIRVKLCENTVAQYAEAMKEGAVFPPAILFHDGNQYILADGFHRFMAASRNGATEIEADVRPGSRVDALRYALAANATHGLRRTNADKRRSVELALQEWPNLSDREIANICAVHHDLAANVRAKQVADSATCETGKRTGADGKQYSVRAKKPFDPMSGDGRKIFDHSIELQEDHHGAYWPSIGEDEDGGQNSTVSVAIDGFRGFLATFTANVATPKTFICDAYAAVYVMSPEALEGRNMSEVAQLAGVTRETFSRSVSGWASKTGIRPAMATSAFKAHRRANGA